MTFMLTFQPHFSSFFLTFLPHTIKQTNTCKKLYVQLPSTKYRQTTHLIINSHLSGSAAMTSQIFIDKLAIILVRDRKQLVVRSRGNHAFFTPGGKREPGESDHQALARECKEELTIDLKTHSITFYGVFEAQAFGKPQGTSVRMQCYTADFQGQLKGAAEIEELRWIDSKFDRNLLSVTGTMILEDLKAKNLID